MYVWDLRSIEKKKKKPTPQVYSYFVRQVFKNTSPCNIFRNRNKFPMLNVSKFYCSKVHTTVPIKHYSKW